MSGDSYGFAAVTATDHNDHRGWLWITVICCMVFCAVLLVFRAAVRYRNRYGLDDLAILIAFLFVMSHSAVLIVALRLGFGVLLTPASKAGIVQAAKLVFSSRTIMSMSLWASKMSALLFIRRLIEPGTWRSYVCDAGLVLDTVWCIAAVLTTSVACSPTHVILHDPDNACCGLDIRISTTTAFNIATELGVFGLAVFFLKDMQIEASQRYQVLASFAARLVNIAINIGYLVSYLDFLVSGESSIGFIPIAIIQEVLVSYCFFSSICSSFFPFPLPTFSPTPQSFELRDSKPKQNRKKNLANRLSTPLSFFGDKARGDREVFKHRARIFADIRDAKARMSSESAESRDGIVREETFEIKTARFSAADALDTV